MKLPISVFIITRNEEARIGMVIEAVREWVDEVVVADSGSGDNTIAIATGLGARVFHKEWEGFGQQKRFAEDQCHNDWLFNLDADEVVTPALRDEIRSVFSRGSPDCDGFRTRILYVYPGEDRPRPFANDYNVERLYKKSAGRYRDHAVFDRVVMREGAVVRQLSAPIAHYAVLNWSQLMDKTNVSSSHNLNKLAAKPAWLLKLRMFLGFPLNFLRNYLVRRHFLGGAKGFVFSLSTAFARTMRIAKALEQKHQAEKKGSAPGTG